MSSNKSFQIIPPDFREKPRMPMNSDFRRPRYIHLCHTHHYQNEAHRWIVPHCEGPAWGARFATDGNNVTTTIYMERRQCVGGEPRASQERAGSVLRPESASLPSFLSLNKKEGRTAGSTIPKILPRWSKLRSCSQITSACHQPTIVLPITDVLYRRGDPWFTTYHANMLQF